MTIFLSIPARSLKLCLSLSFATALKEKQRDEKQETPEKEAEVQLNCRDMQEMCCWTGEAEALEITQ